MIGVRMAIILTPHAENSSHGDSSLGLIKSSNLLIEKVKALRV